MSIKQEALDHYDRIIKQAEKYDKYSVPSRAKIREDINETWGSDDCSYCSYYDNCSQCKLSGPFMYGVSCCGRLWVKMACSSTWQKWIINAKKVKAYIKKHG